MVYFISKSPIFIDMVYRDSLDNVGARNDAYMTNVMVDDIPDRYEGHFRNNGRLRLIL